MHTVRPAAVAGAFYPGDRPALARAVGTLLDAAQTPTRRQAVPPKALIVPHAGYIYSGATAARAYALLRPWHAQIRRVVLLGPVHRVPVRGLALPGVQAFATPLGEVRVDPLASRTLEAHSQVVVSPAAHAYEHSLEVQLPFLQAVLDDFSIVPLAVGEVTPQAVAEVLETLWGGDDTVIVVSSDLSHYLGYAQSRAVDQASVQDMLALRPTLDHHQACGATAVNGLLLAARHHRLRPQLMGLCNSGDTAGDRERVVGYAALSFTGEPHEHAVN